jgi:transcriptional regulator with XRE-family HTH domain
LKPRKKPALVAAVGAKGFELVLRTKPDPKALGAELRRLRELANISVIDLAERMRWHPQNVYRLERGGGAREPMISSINLYLRTLGYELVISARPKPPLRKRAGDSAEPTEDDAPGAEDESEGEG